MKTKMIFKGKLTPLRLKAMRFLLHVGIEELAGRTGFSVDFVDLIESGRAAIHPEHLSVWLKALGVRSECKTVSKDIFEDIHNK